ncbi:hypothetical protein E2C01_093881 [Portunus trituberculatus]|uniref:Uncharacterized protein n=1 Tax=Portunus trituberculatus TaxID=210409 RepID=A0A5B7JZX7_PORTR|nr:hypothetical protein [Portunus trituberculatus]
MVTREQKIDVAEVRVVTGALTVTRMNQAGSDNKANKVIAMSNINWRLRCHGNTEGRSGQLVGQENIDAEGGLKKDTRQNNEGECGLKMDATQDEKNVEGMHNRETT